jgi:hypothetical protein
LKAWLDQELTEANDGLVVSINDIMRLKFLYNKWVNDDSKDGCEGLRENLEVLELLDAHIKFKHPKYSPISDNGRLKMLCNLIKDGAMKVLMYRMGDI